ncbi:MAG: RNA methyltransferase [Lachnospiraceae bacterium]|nr:RNA methyltransferase [Lachnospiraceae bacterium]
MITSASNKKVKNVMLLLAKSKERKRQKLFVAEGVKMFLEAPEESVREIYFSEEFGKEQEEYTEVFQKISRVCRNNGIKAECVKADIFRKMSDTRTPQGVLCLIEAPCYELENILNADKGLYLVLEDIQDPGNLGTMIRAGEGAGISGVIMSSHTADIFNPKTVRATMGSIYRIPFIYEENLEACIRTMKEKGIRVYASHLKGKASYDKEDYHGATAFLIGNEGNGLSAQIADLADSYLRIPMLGKVESLNAAIAATLLVYEAARQRRD